MNIATAPISKVNMAHYLATVFIVPVSPDRYMLRTQMCLGNVFFVEKC